MLKMKKVIHVIFACIFMYASHADKTYEQQTFPSTTIDPEATASVNGKHKCSKLGEKNVTSIEIKESILVLQIFNKHVYQ